MNSGVCRFIVLGVVIFELQTGCRNLVAQRRRREFRFQLAPSLDAGRIVRVGRFAVANLDEKPRIVRLAANLNIAFTARFYKSVVARDFTVALNDGKEFGRRRVELLLKQFHFAVGTRFNDNIERDRFGLPSSVLVSINVLKANLAQDAVGSVAQFFAKVFPKRTIPIVERRKLDNAIGSRYFFAGKKILKFWGKIDPSGGSLSWIISQLVSIALLATTAAEE